MEEELKASQSSKSGWRISHVAEFGSRRTETSLWWRASGVGDNQPRRPLSFSSSKCCCVIAAVSIKRMNLASKLAKPSVVLSVSA